MIRMKKIYALTFCIALLLFTFDVYAQAVVEAEDVAPAPVEMAITVEMPELEAAMAEEQAAAEELAALREEVTALRGDLKQLQETLELLFNQIMADLESENGDLRAEVRRLYERADAGIAPNRNVPRPGSELIDGILAEAEGEVMAAVAAGGIPEEIPYQVINEWGRSPEVAAELPGDVPTLLGLVISVPPGSRRMDVEELGRKLRAQYDAYDNINIEIFDDEDAAGFYAETNVADPVHRILSVSKHAASGRDVILSIQGDLITEIAF